ncbi:MAG: OmpA family protein [Chitinophagales bacterium]|nr:OmpA family protein [Chitinophagales bacterium]
MKQIIITLCFFISINGFSQWGNFGNKIKNKVINKTQDKILDETDKAYDKTYNKTKEGVKGDNNKNDKNQSTNTNNGDASNSTASTKSSENATTQNQKLSATSKYDFVAGEKVIATEEFTKDAIGDFPINWNTNAGGEMVNINLKDGKWLQITQDGSFLPEKFVTNLPDNFTFEFDVYSSQPFSYYSGALHFCFTQMKTPNTEFIQWARFKKGKEGVIIGLDPTDAGNNGGDISYEIYTKGSFFMDNKKMSTQFHATTKPMVHVAVWRQNGRLRLYLDDEKVFDLPKAFQTGVNYNGIVFYTDGLSEENYYGISNLKLAVGEPDTRSKLITEGKFSTSGILFDVNSANIKSTSHGVIKEIADALKENPSVKIKIIGHTDSDGDDATNLALSKKRADAVKDYLASVFGIDRSRMETEGKGETQPVDSNSTNEGKANNRRVEFIKL